MKTLCVRRAPVTCIANGIVMAQNNGCLFVRHGDHHWSGWSVDPKLFKQNRNKKEKKSGKVPPDCCKWLFQQLFKTSSNF